MKPLALAMVLVAGAALADPPADAPVRRVIRVGEPAPADGCFLNNSACVSTGRELAHLRTENAHLKEHAADMPTALLVCAFVVGVVAGGAVVFTLTR